METILAVVVVSAVIFFGALISVGNERQRRAIDNLNEQIKRWAIRDLHIKRERFAREVRVDDPVAWLGWLAAKRIGLKEVQLQLIKTFETPRALLCEAGDGLHQFVFTPIPPAEVRRFRHKRNNPLQNELDKNPFSALPRQPRHYELSILSDGILFDLELRVIWKSLTGFDLGLIDRFWMYEIH